MEKQTFDINAVVRACNAYASANEAIERAQSSKMENRKLIVEFIRANAGNYTKELNTKVKTAIDGLAVGVCADKTGLLGVIKTCCEYSIMPTTVNANRLRKIHKTWTDLNGKAIPNTYDKVHKMEGAGQKTKPVEIVDALALATMQPGAGQTTKSEPQTTTKVAPISPTTSQKAEVKVHPLVSNISSSDEPLSAREHFKVLFNQLTKNETFRGEYCDILAMMLDVEKATLTRCMIQANDEVKV